ncbi:hypothetical protein FACS1894217_10140 [Clostridia bacterium]|nr:hypothetical protein FACS1894217_10140 [Clostridia bacterium]
MAKYGFSGGMPETKILILYALCSLTLPIPMSQLLEVVTVDEGVDYFVFCQALNETVNSAHVLTADKKGVPCYSISPRGYEVSTLMEGQLSNALKMAVRRAAKVAESRAERDSFVITEAFTRSGMPGIMCELTDGHDAMLHIEIMLGSDAQGNIAAKNFCRDAERIYSKVLDILLDTTGAVSDD